MTGNSPTPVQDVFCRVHFKVTSQLEELGWKVEGVEPTPGRCGTDLVQPLSLQVLLHSLPVCPSSDSSMQINGV